MKIRKGDEVIIVNGKDRGKKGKVLKVFPAENRVLVEKVNLQTVYLRRSQQNPQGGITKMEAKIHASNVQLADPRSGKPSRVGYSILADGTKQRISKKSQEIL